MHQPIDEYDFIDAAYENGLLFIGTYSAGGGDEKGGKILFKYLTELEAKTGKEMTLDDALEFGWRLLWYDSLEDYRKDPRNHKHNTEDPTTLPAAFVCGDENGFYIQR